MTKKYILIFILFTLLSIAAGFFYGQYNKTKDGFFCTANTSINSGEDSLSMTINFHMQDGVGYMTLKGIMNKSNSGISKTSLLKHFRYSENDGEFLLSQVPDGVLEVSEKDRVLLQEFIPDFYLTNNVPTHHVRIKELRKGLWIFTTAPVPYLVCAEY
jgi:hypothetical protein